MFRIYSKLSREYVNFSTILTIYRNHSHATICVNVTIIYRILSHSTLMNTCLHFP